MPYLIYPNLAVAIPISAKSLYIKNNVTEICKAIITYKLIVLTRLNFNSAQTTIAVLKIEPIIPMIQ